MRGYWTFETPYGHFAIVPVARGGRIQHHVRFDDETLGVYASPELALEALILAQCGQPKSGVDLANIGLPAKLDDWKFNKLLL
jgi:hypothetical protein